MDRTKLISLALNFASFLVRNVNVRGVILYGSVASNTFDKDSDIDLFIETDKKNKKKVESFLELYKKSKEYEKFRLGGIENEISVKCGKLEEWKSLKRSIVSNGIVLFGRFVDKVGGLNHKVLFMTEFTGKSKAEKIKVWRKLYGYRQKVGKKSYVSEGLVERKVGRGAFISALGNVEIVKDYLKRNKIKYKLIDVWVE